VRGAEEAAWRDHFMSGLEVARERSVEFLSFLGDRISSERSALFAAVIEGLPERMAARWDGGRPLTLLHGDAHFWNALYPADPDRHGCVWFDWQTWKVGVGAFDLAYMIALHWHPARRMRLEPGLVEAYHAALGPAITADYSLDLLVEDYKLGLAHAFATIVLQWNAGIPAEIWWPHVERAFLAFDDLNCRAVL